MVMLTRGERILVLRHRKRLSKSELAKRIGVTAATISSYERGETEPSDIIILALAHELDTTSNMILFGLEGPDKDKPIEPLIKKQAK